MKNNTKLAHMGHGPAGRGMPLRLLTGVTYLKAKSYERPRRTDSFGRMRGVGSKQSKLANVKSDDRPLTRRPYEVARSAAGLLHETYIRYDHLPIHGLTHVIDGERRYRDRGERFHFDPRPRRDLGFRLDLN